MAHARQRVGIVFTGMDAQMKAVVCASFAHVGLQARTKPAQHRGVDLIAGLVFVTRDIEATNPGIRFEVKMRT
ncbi:hypothetical protein D3C77_727050 [compost metagenome]